MKRNTSVEIGTGLFVLLGFAALFFMATGESQAHLNHLIQQGRVVVDHLDAHHAAWYRAV